MKKNVQLINFPIPTPGGIVLPYAWLIFKSWYEDHGRHPDDWYWPDPLLVDDFETVEAVVDSLESKGRPDVLLVSNYTWNFKLHDEIARSCKQRWPELIIVYGGPQQTTKYDQFFFKDYPHVSAVASEGGYGEPVIAEILDQISEDTLDLATIPNIRYAGVGRITRESNVEFNKKNFAWVPIIKRNQRYLSEVIKNFKSATPGPHYVVMLYEGSRGCPYGCTFCEWGLYTNSKINFKHLEMMKEDISALLDLEINFLEFPDANWGSRKEDVEIIRHLIAQRGDRKFPEFINFYVAKNNKKHVIEAQELLLESGLQTDFKFSVQDQDLSVKDAIDRVDLDWDRMIALYEPLLKKYNPKVGIDLIIGLPGQTVDTHYAGYDKTLRFKRSTHPAWINDLLPVSPANDPAYKQKYAIETVAQDNLYNKLAWQVGSTICFRQEEMEQKKVNNLMLSDLYQSKIYNVVQTSTFTRDDYLEMYMTDRMTYAMDGNDSLYGITRYLWKQRGVAPSTFIKSLWREFFNDPQYIPYIHSIITSCNRKFRRRLDQETIDNLEFFTWPGDSQLFFRIDLIFWIAVLINPQGFYQSLKQFVNSKGWLDEGLVSLIDFTSAMIKTCDYDPRQGKIVSTNYDWLTWLEDTDVDPICRDIVLDVRDTTYGPVELDIDWHTQEHRKQFFTMIFKIANPVPYSIFFNNYTISSIPQSANSIS